MTNDKPISERFKEGCADLHQSAEAGAFARRMIQGELTRDDYVEFLLQLHEPNRLLDEKLALHRDSIDALGALIADDQYHAPNIQSDLDYFGADPAKADLADASKALIALIEQTEANDPLNLLALHYVREGANNGNSFVARKLRQTLSLPDDQGTRALDPHGDQQRASWSQFKVTLDGLKFTDTQRDALVVAARSMFQAIIDIHADVERRAPASQ